MPDGELVACLFVEVIQNPGQPKASIEAIGTMSAFEWGGLGCAEMKPLLCDYVKGIDDSTLQISRRVGTTTRWLTNSAEISEADHEFCRYRDSIS
jgi:hypothetical protein